MSGVQFSLKLSTAEAAWAYILHTQKKKEKKINKILTSKQSNQKIKADERRLHIASGRHHYFWGILNNILLQKRF